jgi:hypothetical protein
MKKFAIKVSIFSLIYLSFFILINIIYIGTLALTDWDCQKRIESLKFHNPDFELLVLGASTSSCGIDTEYLTSAGIKSYNLAIGGNSIRTCYIQLEEYLIKYSKRPKYVLLGINPPIQKLFDDNSINPLVEIVMKDYNFKITDVPVLKFRWLGAELIMKLLNSKHRNAKLSYGQIKYKENIPDNTNYTELHSEVSRIEASYWIGELVKLCNENGIEIIILEMPGYKETQNFSEIGPSTLNFRNGYSANLYNFNSKDFCTIFDPDDWIVNSHLNESGANKFSKELLSILKNNSIGVEHY